MSYPIGIIAKTKERCFKMAKERGLKPVIEGIGDCVLISSISDMCSCSFSEFIVDENVQLSSDMIQCMNMAKTVRIVDESLRLPDESIDDFQKRVFEQKLGDQLITVSPLLTIKNKKSMIKLPKYKIHCSNNGQFYYTLVGGNGEVMNTSETYHDKQACRKGIRSARRNSVIAITEDLT